MQVCGLTSVLICLFESLLAQCYTGYVAKLTPRLYVQSMCVRGRNFVLAELPFFLLQQLMDAK